MIINPIDFGAIGDGINDDTIAFNQAIQSLNQEGDVFYAPYGSYKITSTLDMTNIPNETTINICGKLKFYNNINGIKYKSQNSYLYIQKIESINTTIGLELINLNNCQIKINQIQGFDTGIKVIGNNNSGVLYSEIHLDKSYQNKTALLITTSDENVGYVNENQFYIKWIDAGKNGIEFKKGLAQTDPFNGNKIMFPGFEQVSDFGLKLNFCRSNVIFYPRFENPMETGKFTKYCIDEDNTCTYNTYHLHQYYMSKMNFSGKLTSVYGPGISNDGDPTSYMMQSDLNYNRIWYGAKNSNYPISHPDYLFIHQLNEVIPFENSYGYVKSGNNYKKIDFINDNIYETVTNSNLMVNKNTSIIKVNATQSKVILTMPIEKEYEGSRILLTIKFMPVAKIEVKKSSGTINILDSIINTIGVWELVYYDQYWHVVKISDNYFSE